jgi:hypothetical protein
MPEAERQWETGRRVCKGDEETWGVGVSMFAVFICLVCCDSLTVELELAWNLLCSLGWP